MSVRIGKVLALLVVGGLYWQIVCEVTGASEPWDSLDYWRLWYPLSFAIAAVAGYFFGKDAWLAGGLITVVQLPIMWGNSEIGPLVGVGLLFLCILAVPTILVSAITGELATRNRPR